MSQELFIVQKKSQLRMSTDLGRVNLKNGVTF